MKKIYDFAVKWCDKFCSPNTDYTELTDNSMEQDCKNLGFTMDCGYSFSQQYGRAYERYDELHKIIHDITDIQLLGNAVYSQWVSFCRLAKKPKKIASFEARAWFALALCRLSVITENNPELYYGRLKKLHITYEKGRGDETADSSGEVLQHITADNYGEVHFTAYRSSDNSDDCEPVRDKKMNLDCAAVKTLFSSAVSYFCKNQSDIDKTDANKLTAEFTDSDGIEYTFTVFPDDCGEELSAAISGVTNIDNLFLSKENPNHDTVNTVTVKYNKNNNTAEFSERLTVDRKTGSLEYIRKPNSNSEITYKCEGSTVIRKMLENLDTKDFFSKDEDTSGGTFGSRFYTITIDYEKNPSRTFSGGFNKSGLPADFAEFAKSIFEFVSINCIGDILNPSVYEKDIADEPKYIFCGVNFGGNRRVYYYITYDKTILPGDYVLVPAGTDNAPTFAQVVSVKSFAPDKVPFPIENAKRVIRKCTKFRMKNE